MMTMNAGKILARRGKYAIGAEAMYLLLEAVATLTFQNHLQVNKNIDIDRTITIDAAFIC